MHTKWICDRSGPDDSQAPTHITHSSIDLLVLTLVAIVPVSLLVCYVVLAVIYGFVS